MVMEPQDLGIQDLVLARRVLVQARTIAPTLDALSGDAQLDALAILQGVAQEAADRGSRSVASQSVGTAKVVYGAASSWFTDDDRTALRAICRQAIGDGHPVGEFPFPSRTTRNVWPEWPDRGR